MAEAGVTRLTGSVKAYGANCAHADESMPTDRTLTNAKNLILQQLFIMPLCFLNKPQSIMKRLYYKNKLSQGQSLFLSANPTFSENAEEEVKKQ
jgi:hypothetical protein